MTGCGGAGRAIARERIGETDDIRAARTRERMRKAKDTEKERTRERERAKGREGDIKGDSERGRV